MKILKTLTKHIDGRYKLDESSIIECLDLQLIRFEERSRDCEDTLFYIESCEYNESLYESFMDELWTKNKKAKDEELKEWTEGLVDSIIPDEFIDYYFERVDEISRIRHRDNLFYEYRRWLEEIDSKYNIHPEILSFVRSEMNYRKHLLDGGFTERYQFIERILDYVRDDEDLSKLINLQYSETIGYNTELIESISKYVEEIDKTGMLEPLIF